MKHVESEIDVYNNVYDFYDGRCILTGKRIKGGHSYMYPHLFPKGAYPHLKYNRSNIVLVSSIELHNRVDELFMNIRNDLGKYELIQMIKDGKDLSGIIKEYYDKG